MVSREFQEAAKDFGEGEAFDTKINSVEGFFTVTRILLILTMMQ